MGCEPSTRHTRHRPGQLCRHFRINVLARRAMARGTCDCHGDATFPPCPPPPEAIEPARPEAAAAPVQPLPAAAPPEPGPARQAMISLLRGIGPPRTVPDRIRAGCRRFMQRALPAALCGARTVLAWLLLTAAAHATAPMTDWCPRPVAGSMVPEPRDLRSSGGVLRVEPYHSQLPDCQRLDALLLSAGRWFPVPYPAPAPGRPAGSAPGQSV